MVPDKAGAGAFTVMAHVSFAKHHFNTCIVSSHHAAQVYAAQVH
jgi:hypothetical protein